MSPAKIVQQILSQEATVTFTIKTNHAPDEPTNLIVIMDSPSQPDGRGMRTGKTYFHPKLQIIFRSNDSETAYNQAKIVFDLMDSYYQVNVVSGVDTYTVQNFVKLSTIGSLGVENKLRRSLYSFDFSICITQ